MLPASINELHWIDRYTSGRLAIMTRPRGGDWLEVDFKELAGSGVGIIVSCLTAPEESELELTAERAECERAGLKFFSCPIEDRGLPKSPESVRLLLGELSNFLRAGRAIAIHCRQGIGRSSLLCATLLVFEGVKSADAFTWLAETRGRPLPDTDEQRKWVDQFELDYQTRSRAT